MEFGLDKCAEIVLKKGKIVQSQNVILQQKCRSSNREKHTSTRD
jgi:hypothetical protein